MIEPYGAVCCQTSTGLLVKDKLKQGFMLMDDPTQRGKLQPIGCPWESRLVLFPEFFLQNGRPKETTAKGYIDVCVSVPGEETDVVGKWAVERNVYISFGALEVDPE